jgi:hypothetical protein
VEFIQPQPKLTYIDTKQEPYILNIWKTTAGLTERCVSGISAQVEDYVVITGQ